MYIGNIKCASINSPARSVRRRGLLTHSKTRSNPESNVALMTLSGLEVLVSITTDTGKILAKLHHPWHYRQGKNHKIKIVAFVRSPIEAKENEQIKLAKKLKKGLEDSNFMID